MPPVTFWREGSERDVKMGFPVIARSPTMVVSFLHRGHINTLFFLSFYIIITPEEPKGDARRV